MGLIQVFITTLNKMGPLSVKSNVKLINTVELCEEFVQPHHRICASLQLIYCKIVSLVP